MNLTLGILMCVVGGVMLGIGTGSAAVGVFGAILLGCVMEVSR